MYVQRLGNGDYLAKMTLSNQGVKWFKEGEVYSEHDYKILSFITETLASNDGNHARLKNFIHDRMLEEIL